MTLGGLVAGQNGRIQEITAIGTPGQRLLDSGLCPDVGMEAVHSAQLVPPVKPGLDGVAGSILHDETRFAWGALL